MFVCLRYLLGWILSVFRSRDDLVLENLALRQQLLAVHAKRPRPRLGAFDKLFWVLLRRVWSGWKRSLILVTPETVVRWHRAGFRQCWRWISRTHEAVGTSFAIAVLRRNLRRLKRRAVPDGIRDVDRPGCPWLEAGPMQVCFPFHIKSVRGPGAKFNLA